MLHFLDLFRKRRIKLIKQEIKQKEKLIDVQQNLNELLKEEKQIESA